MSNHGMRNSGIVERRSLLKAAAAFGGLSTLAVIAPGASGAAQEGEIPAAASPAVKLEDVLASPNTKLTIERRGQIVLFGINRPYIQNRIDPETVEKLAEAYYQYDHDPSLRAAILFGHGENSSRELWHLSKCLPEKKCPMKFAGSLRKSYPTPS
jgi:hypothetical protein